MSKRKRASIIDNDPFEDSEFDPLELVVPTQPREVIESQSGKKYKKRATKQNKTHQISAALYESQIDWLNDMVVSIKRGGGRSIQKSNVLRAILQVALESNVKLRGVKTEKEIQERLIEALTQND